MRNFLFLAAAILIGAVVSKPTTDSFNCDKLTGVKQLQCWQDEIQRILEKNGIEAALTKVNQYYASALDFGPHCHEFMHPIGAWAHSQLNSNPSFKIPVNASYCSYGFYHGFVETMMAKKGDIKEARQLCDQSDVANRKLGIFIKGSCYHGIGHGIAGSFNVRSEKDLSTLVTKSSTLCQELAGEEELVENCSAGVFNVISNLYIAHIADWFFDTGRPFALCQQFERVYPQCYAYMVLVLVYKNNSDYSKTTKLLEEAPSERERRAIVSALGYKMGTQSVNAPDIEKRVSWCDYFPLPFWNTCIAGFIQGLLGYGKPGEEYKQVFKFCLSNKLLNGRRDACMAESFHSLSLSYTVSKIKPLCEIVESFYRQQCEETVRQKSEFH